MLIFFALPFIVGLLTGLTVGFVGATFPIITAMMGGHPDPGAVTFAFASGFAGVMLSPTHLCLLLTVQYFQGRHGRDLPAHVPADRPGVPGRAGQVMAVIETTKTAGKQFAFRFLTEFSIPQKFLAFSTFLCYK